MTFSVDRLRNVSNITVATSQALGGSISGLPSGAAGGLALSGAAISTNTSVQVTTLAYRTNYRFSAQTSAFGLISVTPIAYLGTSRVDYSWIGINRDSAPTSGQPQLDLCLQLYSLRVRGFAVLQLQPRLSFARCHIHFLAGQLPRQRSLSRNCSAAKPDRLVTFSAVIPWLGGADMAQQFAWPN